MRLVRVGAVALAVLALASSVLAQGAARPRKDVARAGHPDVGGDQDCRACHAQATKASFEAWRQSKHGLDLVTCVVCHGSTGADFTRRPGADRCTGCHPAQAAAPTPLMKGKSCFACHPGHALDPHAGMRETVAARLGADAELRRELQLAGPVNGPNPAAEAAAKPAAPAATPPPAQPAAQSREKDLGTAQPHPPTDRP